VPHRACPYRAFTPEANFASDDNRASAAKAVQARELLRLSFQVAPLNAFHSTPGRQHR